MTSAWIFCDKGKVGSLKQAEALAFGLKVDFEVFDIDLPSPWRYLPPHAGLLNICPLPDLQRKSLPDLIIGIGRQAVLPTLYFRKKCKTIFLQDPKINPSYFDFVIAPKHDNLTGKNVIQTFGSLHKISPTYVNVLPEGLYKSKKRLAAVFIGGSSKHVTYTEDLINQICDSLEALKNVDFLITPSRRTDPKHTQILKNRLRHKTLHFYDFTGENPYLDYIKSADIFFVTTDSISMMSELCSTGKPTYLVDAGVRKQKFQAFITNLVAYEAAQFLKIPLKEYTPRTLNDLETVLEILKLSKTFSL